MQKDCWEILAIEPTTDKNLIKRAYAKQLKDNKPDKNPTGFRQLREAYETALANLANIELLAEDEEYVDKSDTEFTVDANLDYKHHYEQGYDHSYDNDTNDTYHTIENKPNLEDSPTTSSANPVCSISKLETWQQAWDSCHKLHPNLDDADLALYHCLSHQFAQRHTLALDETIEFEETLFNWHLAHAPNYPISFCFTVDTLQWQQKTKYIHTGFDMWQYLSSLINFYQQNNQQNFFSVLSQHHDLNADLNYIEKQWQDSIIKGHFFEQLQWDIENNQLLNDEQSQAYFEQSLFIFFFYNTHTNLVNEFFLAYQHFSWHKHLQGIDRYRFPWHYLPELIQNYIPEFKINTLHDFADYLSYHHPSLYKQWYTDNGDKSNIIADYYYQEADTKNNNNGDNDDSDGNHDHSDTQQLCYQCNQYQTDYQAKPSKWQSWRWHWQFFYRLLLPYKVIILIKKLRTVEKDIQHYEWLNAHGLTDPDYINNIAEAKKTSSKPSKVYQYWHCSKKINFLYQLLFNGFLRPSVFCVLAVIATVFVITISLIYANPLWTWQHIIIDSMGVFLLLSFTVIFWQIQLRLFMHSNSFFHNQPQPPKKSYSTLSTLGMMLSKPIAIVLIVSAYLLSILLPQKLAITLPLSAEASLFLLQNGLGLIMVLLLAYRAKNIHLALGAWYISVLFSVWVLLNILAVLTQSNETILIQPLHWLWIFLSIPLWLKIWANSKSIYSELPLYAEVVMFFISAFALFSLFFTIFAIGTIIPNNINLIITIILLLFLLIFWAISLFRIWHFTASLEL
ncbi:hypothetical protein [Psychrobacter sp. I-STPA6b]|uniref:hypothetical protein n=1 Tax=Psychrobacter sp. I-STPA6b TaxID=2585718 RepID=UPI001D0C9364|nr:hypothetical protein [Psychrobacter sp. I-STPA6b]